MTAPTAAQRRRVERAVEGFGSAAACLGPLGPGAALFVVTRGQFSMIDVVRHVLDCTGPARLSLWTWTLGAFEVEALTALLASGAITGGTLVVDGDVRRKTAGGSRDGGSDGKSLGMELIGGWQRSFGPESVRLVRNHAKIATIEGGSCRFLVRGSMNLNENPRFEQLDITEGGPDFDLVREIEDGLGVLPLTATAEETARASKIDAWCGTDEHPAFKGLLPWRP